MSHTWCYQESHYRPDEPFADEWEEYANTSRLCRVASSCAEEAVEHCLCDPADYPDCGYVEVWVLSPDCIVSKYRVHIDFDPTFVAHYIPTPNVGLRNR